MKEKAGVMTCTPATRQYTCTPATRQGKEWVRQLLTLSVKKRNKTMHLSRIVSTSCSECCTQETALTVSTHTVNVNAAIPSFPHTPYPIPHTPFPIHPYTYTPIPHYPIPPWPLF